jgi:hypothetical protein
LSGSALKVPGGVVASYPLSSQAPTPVEVELGCDKMNASLRVFSPTNFLVVLNGLDIDFQVCRLASWPVSHRQALLNTIMQPEKIRKQA